FWLLLGFGDTPTFAANPTSTTGHPGSPAITPADWPMDNHDPAGGRVTATSADLATQRWRHEPPKITARSGTPGKPMHRDVGDIVGSGVAVGNGVAYFTTVGSGKPVALDAARGTVLKEIDLGPVFAGPSLSRARVYVGGGNTLWNPSAFACCF